MKHRLGLLAARAGVLVAFSAALTAQNAIPPQFDIKKPLHVDGTVIRFQWVNPQSFIEVSTTDTHEAPETYLFALPSSSTLQHLGLKRDAFKQGERVSVDGYLAKSASHRAYARLIKTIGGRVRFDGSSLSYAADGATILKK